MEDFGLGVLGVLVFVWSSVMLSWFWAWAVPEMFDDDERIRFNVLCENTGGNDEGSVCVKDGKIIKIHMRDLQDDDD